MKNGLDHLVVTLHTSKATLNLLFTSDTRTVQVSFCEISKQPLRSLIIEFLTTLSIKLLSFATTHIFLKASTGFSFPSVLIYILIFVYTAIKSTYTSDVFRFTLNCMTILILRPKNSLLPANNCVVSPKTTSSEVSYELLFCVSV